jgi:hypothetical protein
MREVWRGRPRPRFWNYDLILANAHNRFESRRGLRRVWRTGNREQVPADLHRRQDQAPRNSPPAEYVTETCVSQLAFQSATTTGDLWRATP